MIAKLSIGSWEEWTAYAHGDRYKEDAGRINSENDEAVTPEVF